MVTVQVSFAPEQPPNQPPNIEPVDGTARSVTTDPAANAWTQFGRQEMPAGAEVTRPSPLPTTATCSGRFRVNVAVTDFAALMNTTQVFDEPEQSPDQPANTASDAGRAVRVTFVFSA